MNEKKAKALRKSVGYHPAQEWHYHNLYNREVEDFITGKKGFTEGTIVNRGSMRIPTSFGR